MGDEILFDWRWKNRTIMLSIGGQGDQLR